MENLNLLTPVQIEIVTKLLIAMLLGFLVGIERMHAHKTASMRTYSLISLGAALFVIISQTVLKDSSYMGDPMRIAAQIISAAGFLGAGMVIFRDNKTVSGITTATGLWISAGIGMACGFGLYFIAIVSTFLILFIFSILSLLEHRLRQIPFFEENPEKEDIR